MSELLRADLDSREDRVNVVPIPGVKSKIPRINRPWRPLPNIQDFVIKLSTYDWLPLLFGFKRRYPPTLTLHTWYNGGANKFVNFCFQKIRKSVELGHYEVAQQTVWLLMRSPAYQVIGINHVFKN